MLRTQRGLTMRQLAKQAKCSASFLSQLELNRVSPTLVNLEKICTALHISLVDMLREEPQLQQPIQVPLHTADHLADQPLAMRWQRAWLHHLLPQDAPKPFTACSSPWRKEAPHRSAPPVGRSTNWPSS